MNTRKKLFLSAVSSEFTPRRILLSKDLKRPNLDVAVQEDFLGGGSTTLEKLDHYFQHCDAVIHLIGKARGATPEDFAVTAFLQQRPDFATRVPSIREMLTQRPLSISYTQWEAHLAVYHRRPLYIYLPNDFGDVRTHLFEPLGELV